MCQCFILPSDVSACSSRSWNRTISRSLNKLSTLAFINGVVGVRPCAQLSSTPMKSPANTPPISRQFSILYQTPPKRLGQPSRLELAITTPDLGGNHSVQIHFQISRPKICDQTIATYSNRIRINVETIHLTLAVR